MRKSLGNKRRQISDEQIADLTRLYGAFEEGPRSKIFPNESFGFLRITVERPLRLRWEITDDALAVVAADKKISKIPSLDQEQLPSRPRVPNAHSILFCRLSADRYCRKLSRRTSTRFRRPGQARISRSVVSSV